ncbi:hypothetical protein J3Q64DRAFT_1670739 [Phycomyces blakesleeanus]|uniref:Peroxisome assembly protein 22 n=2 Tax=Phycomyces blakesleeanus TaxID=4837 RepID=A0A167Q7R1_PHYB8|nr:hypothetical protein PHYBLDRAFT_179031 [Phycomyces blakesleeanus NRRL 1555(-)]OAD79229.1 hypothetical protein PHYBLDRAFT_179031 [Phycomyces blakesleeanus NRRL 1555(-)]|eukprot:XP_018297269.1 hypothetical protein PHYBLDRAFT_179031 [Phycomyces blakesleeanus NRRL 1555(-)]
MPSSSRVPTFPTWLLRLVGGTSFVALISLALYWYRRFPPGGRRALAKDSSSASSSSSSLEKSALRRTSSSRSSLSDEGNANPPCENTSAGWGSRLLGNVRSVARIGKTKKKITLSLKNTILWNPSPDVNVPNHAFHENGAILLLRLAQANEVYLIIHIHSEDERHQIQKLLENASLVGPRLIDSRRILYCSTEQGKIHLIRHIEPAIHIEGGWELDDGEDIVRKVRPFVNKLIWVVTRRRRTSFNQSKLKESDEGVMGHNVELTDKLSDTSLAQEVGILFD